MSEILGPPFLLPLRHVAPILEHPALAQGHEGVQQLRHAVGAGAGDASGDVLRRGGAVEGGQGTAHGLGLLEIVLAVFPHLSKRKFAIIGG